MSTTENKDLVRRWTKAVNERDLATLATLVADDLVNHAAIPEAQGASGLQRIFEKLFAAVPDHRMICEDLIAEGDRVVARVTVEGTQTGPLQMGALALPATGKTVKTEQIHVYRIAGGKLVEHWAGRDDIGMLRQLGHLPLRADGGAAR